MKHTFRKSTISVLFCLVFLLSLLLGLSVTAQATTDVTFTKVTSSDQITADNIVECSADEAKAWILANWDELNNTSASYYNVAFYNGTDLYDFYCAKNSDKTIFEQYGGADTVSIDELQHYFAYGDDVWLCTVSQPKEETESFHLNDHKHFDDGWNEYLTDAITGTNVSVTPSTDSMYTWDEDGWFPTTTETIKISVQNGDVIRKIVLTVALANSDKGTIQADGRAFDC